MYDNPDLLVETEWLFNHLSDADICIVEMAQDASDFEVGHIPGAVVSPDWQIKSALNHRLVATPDEAKAWFESVGIGPDTLVIAYDRTRCRDAARLWWVLNYYGHFNVRVLNGGWAKWTVESRPTESGVGANVQNSSELSLRVADHAIESTVDKLKRAIGAPGTVIWDIRSFEEFTGENTRGNLRSGHVPGAVHLEWTNLVNERDHTFKTADELETLLWPLGIVPEKVIHIY